ncbi:MAG: alanine--tRNA ligase [Candidatus Melainabacteria bacterium]|nr:alanine--tRNA ligase [Candidatus Melainabacteria bacterium]
MTFSGAEIRDKFISYFRDKRGHLYLPSSSLIPDNPTLLLTSAGMVQFVPVFLGQSPAPTPPRAVTVQKCARAGGKDSDIENVGRTARHHTFFEMLGNFSFGDYFKKEIIPWSYELVTKDLGLEPEKISVTIFKGDELNPADEEAYAIWNKDVGIPADRIFRMSRRENFWGPPGPTGPCGPCSEIFYDRGPDFGCSSDPSKCGIGVCECDRYLEIWNLVFMELFKDENGAFTPLAAKNVDTGSGLERVSLVLQKKNNTFETDLFMPILDEVCKIAGVKYTGGKPIDQKPGSPEHKIDSYIKIICDHVRCVTFLVADGVRTSNVSRGYVLRFITRRAARFGRLLGMKEPFIYKLVPKVVETYGSHYKELKENEQVIIKHLKAEEEAFAKSIERGTALLDELLEKNDQVLPGKDVFDLYATYGFPVELTTEIAQEHGKTIDMEGFLAAKKDHRAVSAVGNFNINIAGDEALSEVVKKHGTTTFSGYKGISDEAKVVALVKDGRFVDHVEEGEEIDVILDKTPFYAESGGQVGDTGLLETDDARLEVLDTKKHEGLHLHKVKALSGVLQAGQTLHAKVDAEKRNQTVLHHSTAHLFHAAVRDLFGKHVTQAGSQVGPAYMRFDFTLEKQPRPEELRQIEKQMNDWVKQNAQVTTQEMSLDDAKRTGAIAMFGEKYGDTVRVLSMGDFSLEFCGGTHVAQTGEIGPIKIISEESVSQGTRRVSAYSGPKAWTYLNDQLTYLSDASKLMKVRPNELATQIEKLQDTLKDREKQLQKMEERMALSRVPELLAKAKKVGAVCLIAESVDNLGADALKAIAEDLKSRSDNTVVALASSTGPQQVAIVVAVSDAVTKNGVSAGDLVKAAAQICGGGGGGKPQLAQAGGKQPEMIPQALKKVVDMVEDKLSQKAN